MNSRFNDEPIVLSLSVFDWRTISTALYHFASIPFAGKRKLFSKDVNEGLFDFVDKIESIWSEGVKESGYSERVPARNCPYFESREVREFDKTVMLEATLTRNEFDILFVAVETVMKNEENISGLYDFKVIYCWESALDDLNETYNRLKRVAKETLRFPEIEVKQPENNARVFPNAAASPSTRTRTIKLGDSDLVFRWIPPGTCRAGADFLAPESFSDEIERTITFDSGFWMMDSLVTTRMLCVFAQHFKHLKRQLEIDFSWLLDEEKQIDPDERSNYPAELTWRDATKFCRLLSLQFADKDESVLLPTEDQWEYAALAGRDYSDVNSRDDILKNGWVWENLEEQEKYPFIRRLPHKSDEKAPNPWGLYGMQGNLCEWTSTRYRHPLVNDNDSILFKDMYVLRGCSDSELWSHGRTSFRRARVADPWVRAGGLRPVIVSKTR